MSKWNKETTTDTKTQQQREEYKQPSSFKLTVPKRKTSPKYATSEEVAIKSST